MSGSSSRLQDRGTSEEEFDPPRGHMAYAQPDRLQDRIVEGSPPAMRPRSRSRTLALIAVCTMSIGSHFGAYLLGPLKSRLNREMGTSNSQFSLLIASFNLNSTWTPLIGGIFVSRFGTAWSSIATTGCVLMGQVILLLGVLTEHLVIMALGLFIFGLGLTPLMVVQETLVSHLSSSGHLGMALALGLVSGKTSSFLSSFVSLPLADRYGDAVPFSLAVGLCAFSFGINWLRIICGWGEDLGEAKVKEKRQVKWAGFNEIGDVYWVYILLNLLAGTIWQPFLHLSANLVQLRYDVSEESASRQASILLAGAIILYPIVGHITDRFNPTTPRTTFYLIIASSLLTLSCYTYLCLPPTITHMPWPGLLLFALGHGSATLLLVILVPRILPPHLIPLGLGIHKSMESAASSLSQTLAGEWLDIAKADDPTGVRGGETLLRTFWSINVLQLSCAVALWRFERWKRLRTEREQYIPLPTLDDEDGDLGFGEGAVEALKTSTTVPLKSAVATSAGEKRRGLWFFSSCVCFVVLVWSVFMGVAWHDLG